MSLLGVWSPSQTDAGMLHSRDGIGPGAYVTRSPRTLESSVINCFGACAKDPKAKTKTHAEPNRSETATTRQDTSSGPLNRTRLARLARDDVCQLKTVSLCQVLLSGGRHARHHMFRCRSSDHVRNPDHHAGARILGNKATDTVAGVTAHAHSAEHEAINLIICERA